MPKGTFWPLNGQVDPRDGGRAGWRVNDNPKSRQGVTISRSDVRLAAAAGGPLSLTWLDGSLGGLTLPRGMALDGEGNLYLLGQRGKIIKRLDYDTSRFVPFLPPPGLDGYNAEAHSFRRAASLAILGRDLYVADEEARQVKVFDLSSRMLRYVWRSFGENRVLDLASHSDGVYLLDGRAARIYEHTLGANQPRLAIQLQSKERDWRRLVVDSSGRIYILDLQDQARPRLVVFDRTGKHLETITDAGDVRDRFDPPAIRLFYPSGTVDPASGRFCLSEGLARPCDRRRTGVSLEHPLLGCQPGRPPVKETDLRWQVKELLNPVRLAERLRTACDRVSGYVRSRLTAEGRQSLDQWDGDSLPAGLRSRLVWELNRLLSQPDLYGRQSFALVKLSAETQRLLASQPVGLDRVRLNRMLLEAAFSEALARSPYTTPPPPLFTREGKPAAVEADEPLGSPPYQRYGYWISQAIDSEIYRCQWHRLELELSALPPGAAVTVSTWTADEDLGAPSAGVSAWQRAYTVAAGLDDEGEGPGLYEGLIQSREGQYLWLKVELWGDGYNSPAVKGIRVHFPRNSYLAYLPAIYAEDDESRWFLERFLSLFQTEWDEIEQRLDDMTALFDPAAVPAEGGFLEWLASRIALPLEGDWTAEQKRVLLKAGPRFYGRRGTVKGLQEYLRAYILNMTDLTEPELARFKALPVIVEGFRERRRLMLSQANEAELNLGTQLWSPGEVGRLQLGSFAETGAVRLVSTGDPVRDIFHEFAHRFRVLVPAAWVRTASQEAMLRRALNAEKPAQTSYQLCLVEPRFRVGLQSTVGLDTIIGGYPAAQLACQDHWEVAPSRPPRHRLGYDTILGGESAGPPQLAPSLRVGIDTTLR